MMKPSEIIKTYGLLCVTVNKIQRKQFYFFSALQGGEVNLRYTGTGVHNAPYLTSYKRHCPEFFYGCSEQFVEQNNSPYLTHTSTIAQNVFTGVASNLWNRTSFSIDYFSVKGKMRKMERTCFCVLYDSSRAVHFIAINRYRTLVSRGGVVLVRGGTSGRGGFSNLSQARCRASHA